MVCKVVNWKEFCDEVEVVEKFEVEVFKKKKKKVVKCKFCVKEVF